METDEKHLSLVSGPPKTFNVVQILKLLLKKSGYENNDNTNTDEKDDPVFMCPSEYIKQMIMTTEKRTDFLLKIGRKFDLKASIKEQKINSFKAIPSIVIFQRFEPGATYNVNLLIRNVSKISQYLRMICERNPTFKIEFKGSILNTRLAPGMALAYNIKFCPEEKRDYEYEATFVSDREVFRVPIIAIGPRAILDFPDQIEIPTTAVKILSSKTLLVRNIGHVPAIFSLYTEDPRFSIAPSQGMIEEEEMIQFTLSFLSNKIGNFESKLFLKYESGEIVRLDLQASAVNSNIRLERGCLKMEDTYLSMSKSKPLTIHNKSDHIVKFSWMKYKDSEEDEKRREKYKHIFNQIKNIEMIRCVDLVHYNICVPEAHSLICQRIYADEITSLTNEKFFYHNCNFVLEPTEGEIWPQGSTDVMVFFQPDEIGETSSTAYLEITGRENRLPLSLSGVCIGPNIQFTTVTLDIGSICLCSSHNYEVMCTNQGFIPGTMVHKPKSSDFGGLITIEPLQLKLQPGDFKLLSISFSSNRKGDFVERIDFVIKESLEVVSLYIKGCVVCPILRFDRDSLDFGITALGWFTNKQDLCLKNHSTVSVSFNMSVPDDGYEPAVTFEDFSASRTKPTFPCHPKEFIITPVEGVVSANSSLKIEISYTPNIARSGKTSLRLEMWDSESEAILLPIIYSGKIADLAVQPPEVTIGFCFINLPYRQNISIENKSNIDGYFYIIPQSVRICKLMEYSMIIDQGYLKPGQAKMISMTVIARSLGKQEIPIMMLPLGGRLPITCCNLICNGQGPVVSVDSTHLDWGNLTLLRTKSLELSVNNDSPIPAEFTTSLVVTSGQFVPEHAQCRLIVGLFVMSICIRITFEILLAFTVFSVQAALAATVFMVTWRGSKPISAPRAIVVSTSSRLRTICGTVSLPGNLAVALTIFWSNSTPPTLRDVPSQGFVSAKTLCSQALAAGPAATNTKTPPLQKWRLQVTLMHHSQMVSPLSDRQSNPRRLPERRNSPWSVRPAVGELGSNQSIKLELMAFLRDAGKHSDRLLIKITNSRTIFITLIANGIGSCIVSKPNLFPTFDMGLLFSHQDICLPITLINEGNRHHQLLFANIMDVRPLMKNHPQIQASDRFQVEPNLIELPPGATTTVFCKIHWNKNETVTEEWYLHVFIQGTGKRELQSTSLFRASFTEPHISFNKTELQFRVDVDTSGEKLQDTDEFYVINESGLDLNTHLTLDPPFHLITESNETVNKMDIILQKNVQIPIQVYFAFNLEEKYKSRIIKRTLKLEYEEHPNKDRLKCKAEVNFPTIIPIPRELYFSCELGSSDSRKLALLNEMPIPVSYRFEWLQDSISINLLETKSTESHEERKDNRECLRNLEPPLNTPEINEPNDISQTKKEDAIGAKNKILDDEFSTSADEVRGFLMRMIDSHLLEEPELKALQSLNTEPPKIEFINKFIEISPQEGMLLPYTTQYTNLAFHGLEPLKIEAKILCEIVLGSPEIIQISAVADKLRFNVTKNYIDLGHQIFCEKCQASFHLESQCFIPFSFRIQEGTFSKNLKVEPNNGKVEPMSNVLFQITYQPDTIGPFEKEVQIAIELAPPFPVHLRGFSVIPQVYFCLPKTDSFKNYPFEFGYYAIQSLEGNYMKADLPQNESYEEKSCCISVTEADLKKPTDEDWEIIDIEDAIPSANDIDMAFERLLAKKFMKENSYALETHRSEHRKGGISGLFTPEYLIDMGYLVVQKKVQRSATLINFGPGKVEVRLKKSEKKGDFTKLGIYVEFNDRRNLFVGESTILQVTCHPKQERYKERVTDIQHVIYIQVTHGFTIPVIIKAIITYPFLSVNTQHLDFCNVIVGQCHQMRLLIRNEGHVECQWEAQLISNRKKRDEGPFYVQYTSDIFFPGNSGVIDVYFKPRKSTLLSIQEEGKQSSPVTSRTAKSGAKRSERGTSVGPSIQNVATNTEAISELEKIPSGSELNTMDVYSCYECKIQSILLIEKILSLLSSISPRKDKSSARSSAKKKFDDTFLGFEYDTLKTVLKFRLSMPDFKNGFVLQTLDNNFLKNNVTMLHFLLEIVDHIEFSMFVTFHNSIAAYKDRMDRLSRKEEEKAAKVVQAKFEKLERMSQTEIESLSEDEKRLYINMILSRRNHEATSRRREYEDTILKIKERKSLSQKLLHPSLEKPMKSKTKLNKKNKTATIDSTNDKPDAAKPVSARKGTESQPSSKSSPGMRSPEKQKEWQDINAAIDQYLFDLAAILNLIQDWDPEMSNKRPAKGKDKPQAMYREVCSACPSSLKQYVPENMAMTTLSVKEESTMYNMSEHQLRQNDYQKKEKLKIPTNSIGLVHSAMSERSDSIGSNISLTPTIIEEPLKPTWILQPYECQTYIVRFFPDRIGHYREDFSLSIVDSIDKTYNVKVEGISDIPRINMDASVIFSSVKHTKIDETNDPTYFLDTSTFDFGSLLINRKDKGKQHRKNVQFKFNNISLIPAQLSFSLKGDNTNAFSIQSEQPVYIKPEETCIVELSAGASKLGTNSARLILNISENPEVHSIELRCNGTKVDVELEDNNINFDRVLLYREEKQTVRIHNKSTISIFWVLKTIEDLNSQIAFSTSRGSIKPKESGTVDVTLHASKVGLLEENTLNFEVFLRQDDSEPLLTEVITVTAEIYDVSVDVNYANPIDLKSVKVDSMTNEKFTIKNRGPYEIKYAVQLEPDEVLSKIDSNLSKGKAGYFDISPDADSILPEKTVTVNVLFKPRKEIVLKNAPILKCYLFDTFRKSSMVAEVPLTVSVVAYYTRFRLHPFPELNFGTVGIHKRKIMYLNVENTGKFTLHFTVSSPGLKSPLHSTKGKKKDFDLISKRDKKSPRHERPKLNNEPSMKIGSFVITKIDGEIKAGQIETLQIICSPESEGEKVEEINIFVADCVPNDKNGKTIKLLANCCMPQIDFHDLDTIFHENNVVHSLQDFKCPKELGAHTVFTRREKCLYFCRIPVLSTHTTCFKLCNKSEVQSDVMIFLRPEMLTQNSNIDAFTVNPTRDCIPPMSNRIFTISFTPNLIETYSAVLEAEIELPSHLKTDRLSVRLLGEACVPEVILIEPSARTKRDHIILSFNRILVGETGVRKLAFQNIGILQAKVIVEVCDDPNFLFSLEPFNDSTSLAHMFDSVGDESNDRYIVCTLTPDEVANFRVKFQPSEVGRFESSIKIAVMGNLYENITLTLDGESIIEAIVLDGLEFADANSKIRSKTNISDTTRRNRKASSKNISARSSLKMSTSTFATLMYKLDYGSCFLNRMSKISFKVVNKTEDRCFRFEWSQHPNVVLTPTIGHVGPCRSKEIVATFLAVETTSLFHTLLDCMIQEIVYSDLQNLMSWDDRQTNINWNKRPYDFNSGTPEKVVKKIIEPMAEPIHEVVSGSTRYIQLLISANAAYSEYECKIQHISFKDTLMFQSTDFKFLLTNPASVNLEYEWKLTVDDEYPIRLGESALRSICKQRIKPKTQSRPSSRQSNGILNSRFKAVDNRNDVNYISQYNAYERGKFSNSRSEEYLHQKSDLFSSTACLSDISTDSWIDSENWPFEIKPENGIIPPGQSLEFNLKFSPLDVFDYKACLKCIIENLNPKFSPLCIPIKARSLLPYCHFEILESDYLTSGRRNKKLPGPIGYDIEDPSVFENTKVIEFNVIGVGECHIKNFNLVNPTMDDYNFSWSDRTNHQMKDVPNFHCRTMEGIVQRGKRLNVSFTFHAEDVGTFESFWLFKIDKYKLETLFLIVAHVIEPEAYCLPVHLQMNATALGWKVSDKLTIVNREDFELPFKILTESLYSEGRFHTLIIKPMSGILIPNSEQTLNVDYQPKMDGEVTFSVQCRVEKMKNPITTFVTTKAYSIEPHVFYKNSEDELIEIYQHRDNFIDFGRLHLNKPSTIEFEISNVGKIKFLYRWDLSPQNLKTEYYNITLYEKEGHVDSESEIICHLSLTAFEKVKIKGHLLKLEINKGPLYYIYLKASARKPSVEFSFSQFDFGPRYIQETIAAPYHVDLQIKNFEKTPSIIECLFENLPHILVELENISQEIDGNSSVTVRIHFRPIACIHYQESLNFLINSASEKNVIIRGEGIPYKVRLENPCEKCIDLGNIPIGKISTRKINILNEGRAPIELKFGLIRILEASKERKKIDPFNPDLQKEQSDKSQEIMALSQALSIQPEDSVILQPKKKLKLVLKFKPNKRIKQFLEKIGAQIDCTIIPFTILRGSGVGAEFQLNRTYISFGSIVEGCTLDSKLMLLNTGDVGARFKWNTSKLGSNFNIKPVSGYCSPGMDVPFVVSFQPIHQTNFIEGEATIEIEKYVNMTITVCGGCGKLPDPLDTLNFAIQVRQKQSKQVIITNDSSETWVLKPEANGDYFFTEEVLKINPKNTGFCSVSYCPLVMNAGKSSHKGKLIVKLPGGRPPILYSLSGTSLPPDVVAKIVRQFPAKTKYTESLSVYNWLNRPQKFDCKIELVKLETSSSKNENSIYTFSGNTKLDVPPRGRRDYRAVFHCYHESNFNFKVTFANSEGEYQYYELQYKVMKPEVLEVIKLTTNVRSTTYHIIQLENPLDNGFIKYNITCPHQDITIYDNTKKVPALSSEKVKIEYNPLLPSEEVTRLEVSCTELGISSYELRLTAKTAPPEELIRVIATLGRFSIFPVTVSNLSRKNNEFTVKLENPSFTCAKSIMVQAQNSEILEVKYEPCDIENVTATLIISSNNAGEFIFPIIGTCFRPKPQGPFFVRTNQSCSIEFKNVFLKTKTFEFFLDSPSGFSINTLSETIESKKSTNIVVNFNTDRRDKNVLAEKKFPITGKLIISSTDTALSKISWIYYLISPSQANSYQSGNGTTIAARFGPILVTSVGPAMASKPWLPSGGHSCHSVTGEIMAAEHRQYFGRL
ncbi:hydrocephalus-inducing protein homolog [Belonocnema kinseyi]|uniref:hydrocephalus-inducing protein homolog n=1 Tax=Belonocnema kinseyi TaxID=2817044 RepID=UPI00143D240F|nr:hydrocephalus-inducing protein homolog [Belonocnema kinseyi]